MAIRYEYYITGGDAWASAWDEQWMAQTFTPSLDHKITSVKLLLNRAGQNLGTVTVSIKATSGNHPTGGDLCVGTINGNTIPEASPQWREITLGAGYVLSADTKYAIVVRAPDAVASALWWKHDQTSPTYAEGNYEISYNSGGSWLTYTIRDFMFEEWGVPIPPTVTTQAASSVEATTATGNGNITNTGGENCDIRGIVWDLASHGDPGGAAPGASGYANDIHSHGSYGTGAFTQSLTGLPTGDIIYCRAYAHNSAGYNYGTQRSFLTKPAAPTNVQATDGDHTDKVVITWTKSTGATGYQVYRDGTPLGWLGDVATKDDTGAAAPTITKGSVTATDGDYADKVVLDASGYGTNNGTTHTYKVRAKNATGESVDSGTNTGYRAPGALSRQWQKSAGDSPASYSDISGATSDPYDYMDAPAPTVTPGTASASDGSSIAHVTLSLAGESANVTGRYYRAKYTAAGCTTQYTTANRGYKSVGSLTRQWYRSAGDSDASYSVLGGATTDPYNDTTAPAPTITPGAAVASDGLYTAHVALSLSGQSANGGAGRYYKCLVSATGAASQYSTANRGYRGVGSLTYQWQRSAADSDASYSNIDGATTDPYNDTGAPGNGEGRYYRCVENATGATQQISAVDRGFRALLPRSYGLIIG